MNLNAIIAANLKRLRQERGLSLSQLAELSEVSKVMLSQIEKAESNPTINMIWKIANGLKVPYTQLIDEHKNDPEHVPRVECQIQNDLEGHYRIFKYYNSTPARNFEMFMIELDPETQQISVGHSELTQEYLLVTEGLIQLNTNQQQFILASEDAICFDASYSHTYTNLSNQVSKAVLMIHYRHQL